MANISVFGGGAWGRALAAAFRKKNETSIVSRRILNLPYQITQQEAQKSEYFIVAISSNSLISWLSTSPLPKKANILVASKGITQGLFVNDIFTQFYPEAKLSFLAGPSFAKEVLQNLPCALNIHSFNKQVAQEWISLFPDFIKPYVNEDVIGAEIGGAYKNVIAIASGICEGLKLGSNAKASLVARGLVEMTRFGIHFGAKEETFLGLSGAGDLFLTANSTLSRNFRVGIGLSKRKNLQCILDEIGEIAEGVHTSKEIYALAKQQNIYVPIVKEVTHILEGKDPMQSLKALMNR
ncbi:MAG: NAD(P)H-dependent glycerol-3-phosphate dehydrogenase [Helicobacter sp.]|nr:NAD(P)H-dependent glycerol-3-phosphate dehydrogenase [Helicobacter sp.]